MRCQHDIECFFELNQFFTMCEGFDSFVPREQYCDEMSNRIHSMWFLLCSLFGSHLSLCDIVQN